MRDSGMLITLISSFSSKVSGSPLGALLEMLSCSYPVQVGLSSSIGM